MARQNCWEFMKCGRELGGANAMQLGVCPASTTLSNDGTNGGRNGGRCCWYISGTFCHGEAQGTYAQKRLSCLTCSFYKTVRDEEGMKFVTGHPLSKTPAR